MRSENNEWQWVNEDNNPLIYPFIEINGVSELLFNNYGVSLYQSSVFLDMDLLFSAISRETNNCAWKQLENEQRKNKSDNKWFDMKEDEMKADCAL